MIAITSGSSSSLYSSTTTSNPGSCVCAKSDNPGATVLKIAFVRNGGIFPLFLGEGLSVRGGDVSLGCWLVDEEATHEPAEGGVSIGAAGKDAARFRTATTLVTCGASEAVVTSFSVTAFLHCGRGVVFLEVDGSFWMGWSLRAFVWESSSALNSALRKVLNLNFT